MIRRLILLLCFTVLYSLNLASADIWKDDFEREEIGEEWTAKARGGGATDWKIDNGILEGSWPKWSFQMIYMREYPFLDYTIKVRTRIDEVWNSLHGTGIFFRASDPEEIYPSYYTFGIGMSSAGFLIDHGGAAGRYQRLPGAPVELNIDEWYVLELVAIGNRFFGYINDKPVVELKDRDFEGKYIGLLMGQVDSSFDDFMISDQVDDNALADFAVAPIDNLAVAWGYIKQNRYFISASRR